MTGCSDQQKPLSTAVKPNIIWIVTEDISPALGCYGDDYAKTPTLDKFAKKGIRFEHTYATAPICAPSRSCLITGIYTTSLGTQHLRTEVAKPEFIRAFPEYLKDAGYFTTNYGKTDYNFNPEGIWDYWEQDRTPWRQRKEDQPFFSFLNIGNTHEGPANREESYKEAVADLPSILKAAEMVGISSTDKLTTALKHSDPGVRFWAITGFTADPSAAKEAISDLEQILNDSSPVNQIAASEALCQIGICDKALPVLQRRVEDNRPWLALYAARTIQLIGNESCPLAPVIYKVLEKNLGEHGTRLKYKDFNFAAFTSWALEVALINCGMEIPENDGN